MLLLLLERARQAHGARNVSMTLRRCDGLLVSPPADRRTVHGTEVVGKPLRFAIDDKIDVALPPARHGLAAVLACGPETKRVQHAGQLRGFLLARAELDELDVAAGDPRGDARRTREAREAGGGS